MHWGVVYLFVFVSSCIKQLFIPKKEAPFTRPYTVPVSTYPVQTTKPSSWVDLYIPWRCFSCIKPPPLTSVKLAHRLALVLLSKHELKYDHSFSLPFPLHLTFASAAPELYLSQIKTELLYFYQILLMLILLNYGSSGKQLIKFYSLLKDAGIYKIGVLVQINTSEHPRPPL